MTFSIAAWDPRPGSDPEWGIAVASKFLGVGAVVPFAAAGAGAVATQAFANLTYGPRGLELLAAGASAPEVVEALVEDDVKAAERQVGIVDSRGGAAAFTGSDCFDWAGDVQGDGFTCQGNILAGPDVVTDMARAFREAEGDLAERLLAALVAGDEAGGDRRGRQGAALLVVREKAGYGGATDVAVDLRVDDHTTPVVELRRLLELHHLFFPRPEDLSFVPLDERLVDEVRSLLRAAGYEAGEGAGVNRELKEALFAYMGTENLEERWTDEDAIEAKVLEHLRNAPAS